MRVLFILKEQGYGYGSGSGGGLRNSARLIAELLRSQGDSARVAEVTDNNDIDRVVADFCPDVAIIEALWVVPAKFVVLKRLHPTVRWVVRVHSELPFLAQEGIALGWIGQYLEDRVVTVAFNSDRVLADFAQLFEGYRHRLAWLPNWYPLGEAVPPFQKPSGITLNVGCFGALRGLKNQLAQAVAAVEYANAKCLLMNFHINRAFHGGADGPNVLRNLRALFAESNHRLVEHPWLERNTFLKLLATMDLGLQVSFSESFNLIAADLTSLNVPIVVSREVRWASGGIQADPTDVSDIQAKMGKALGIWSRWYRTANQEGLRSFNGRSARAWREFLEP